MAKRRRILRRAHDAAYALGYTTGLWEPHPKVRKKRTLAELDAIRDRIARRNPIDPEGKKRQRDNLRLTLRTFPNTTPDDWIWYPYRGEWVRDEEGLKEWIRKHPRPHRDNPGGSPHGAIFTIGKLRSLTVITPDGRTGTITCKNRWLAWDGHAFHICTVRRQVDSALPRNVLAAHQKFHHAPPNGRPFLGHTPARSKGMTSVGLIKGLVYEVPRKVRSPGKNGSLWTHNFGDTVAGVSGNHSQKVMPLLQRDSKGNLFITRRKGNIFRVSDWLRG